MPVNLFGLCANMPTIMQIAKKYNLKVIEDSACGFDGWIEDTHSGTFGDVGCFSFHPRKSICTGEGGMLITNDDKIASKVSQLKDHGASKSDLQRHKEKGGSLLPDFTMRGYNYRMTDMQGALGVCQMEKKEYIMNGRREVAGKYDVALKEIEQLQTPYTPEDYSYKTRNPRSDFFMSYAADRLSIALPLYAGMSDEEFEYVVSNIKEALK